MMASRPTEPFCLFCNSQGGTTPPKERDYETSYLKYRKKDKMSLKRTSSKHSFTQNFLSTPTTPTSPAFPSNRSVQPTFTTHRQSFTMSQPLTPKPSIRFSWNVDLDQTKKKELVEEVAQQQITDEEELRKTKPLHKVLKRLSGLQMIQKASMISMISIPDSSPKVPKVQQSLIMVDYFHPTSQQMLGLQNYLSEKQNCLSEKQNK